MNEAKNVYVFKADERCFCVTGTIIVAADTKEEARSVIHGLKNKDVRDELAVTKIDSTDNEPFIDGKYTKILFHRPEKINRFMNVIWYLEYELFLRVPIQKGLKSISYSDG